MSALSALAAVLLLGAALAFTALITHGTRKYARDRRSVAGQALARRAGWDRHWDAVEVMLHGSEADQMAALAREIRDYDLKER